MFNWKMIYAPNYLCRNTELKTIKDIKESGFEIIRVEVPWCLELDLMREGKIRFVLLDKYIGGAKAGEYAHMVFFGV